MSNKKSIILFFVKLLNDYHAYTNMQINQRLFIYFLIISNKMYLLILFFFFRQSFRRDWFIQSRIHSRRNGDRTERDYPIFNSSCPKVASQKESKVKGNKQHQFVAALGILVPQFIIQNTIFLSILVTECIRNVLLLIIIIIITKFEIYLFVLWWFWLYIDTLYLVGIFLFSGHISIQCRTVTMACHTNVRVKGVLPSQMYIFLLYYSILYKSSTNQV